MSIIPNSRGNQRAGSAHRQYASFDPPILLRRLVVKESGRKPAGVDFGVEVDVRADRIEMRAQGNDDGLVMVGQHHPELCDDLRVVERFVVQVAQHLGRIRRLRDDV